jgi:septal ring-binding cell division protein DamX
VRDSEFSQTVPDRVEPARLWGGAALVAGGAALGIAIYALVQQAPPQSAASAQATPAETPGPAESKTGVPKAAPKAPAASPQAAPSAATPPSQNKGIKTAAVAAAPSPATAPKPAAAAKPGSDASPAGGNGLLESRLSATQQWLATEAQETFSIQLLGTNDPEQLKEHLNVLSKVVEINRVFVYRTKARQKASITVLYGSFTSPRAAREALDKLPASLRANQPILRTVQGIRAEIKQHQAS